MSTLERDTSEITQTTLNLGKPLNCMSVIKHPGALLVTAVGGPQTLKLASLTPHGLADVKKTVRLTNRVTSEVNFSINDVEWCANDSSRNVLASAASNGNITIWDFSRDGRSSQERVIPAHPRTVNRINWHPQDDGLLLSASQDTTVKLWDRRGRNYQCAIIFTPRSDSVRDAQWNPIHTHTLAVACENGSFHLFDRRKPNGPLCRVMRHSGPVLALEWHLADPFMLATGSRDRCVKIWDLREQNRQDHKETCIIHTVSAVNRIRWRPGHPSQLSTTSAVQDDNAIHLWDIHHPYLPLATLEGHQDVCGAITWLDTPCRPHLSGTTSSAEGPSSPHRSNSAESRASATRFWSSWRGGDSGHTTGHKDDRDLEQYTGYLGVWQHVLTCGRDGKIIFHSLSNALRPREAVPPTIVALSPRGDVMVASEKVECCHDFIGLKMDERTAAAPGIFAERPAPENTCPLLPPVHNGYLINNSGHPHVLPSADSPRGFTAPVPESLQSQSSRTQPLLSSQASSILSTSPVLPLTTTESILYRRSNSSNTVAAESSKDQAALTGLKQEPWLPRVLYRFTWDNKTIPGTGCEGRLPEPESQLSWLGITQDGVCTGQWSYVQQTALLAAQYKFRPGCTQLTEKEHVDRHDLREELCRYNAIVACKAGQGRMARVWEILAILLSERGRLEEADMEEELQEKRLALTEDQGRRGAELGNSPDEGTLVSPAEAVWDGGLMCLRREVLTSLLDELLEEGDVQNAAAVLQVVESTGRCVEGERREDLVDMTIERVRECYVGYIELLRRLELYQAATGFVAGLADQQLRQLHIANTTTYVSCGNCRRTMSTTDTGALAGGATGTGSSPWCTKCQSLASQCSICLQPVRGVYAWCPSCSHGGHMEHLREWFLVRKMAVCPTGCGHVCHVPSITTHASLDTSLQRTGWTARRERGCAGDVT